MLQKLNITILCLFLFGTAFTGFAQQYGYIQYNAESGAPFDKVRTVLKDPLGFVWIGSPNGLYRFDGTHFDLYSEHTQSQNIHQLHKQADTLFFVNDRGVYQVNDVLSQPKAIPLLEGTINETDDLPFYPNGFILGKDQSIWLSQSNHSIGRFHQGKFTTYPFSTTEHAQQLSISRDMNGGIWVLSALDGLFLFNETTNTFEKQLAVKGATALLLHQNYLLVGGDVLSIYTIEEKTLKHSTTIALENDLVSAMSVTTNDEYLIGTRKGKLYALEGVDGSLKTIYGANEAHRVEELDFGPIHEIYEDRESTSNGLWICSETGLWLLQQRFFKTVKDLPMNNPIGVAIGSQGKAYAPINYLYEIAPEQDEFTARPILDNLQVNAVAEGTAGTKWVTTSTPKVALLKYTNAKISKRYDFDDRGEAIFNLFPDSKENLWFCQAPVDKPIIGLAQINANGEIRYYDETKGFSSRILSIKESSRGEIYAAGIGEKSYLYRYDPQLDTFENLSPKLPFTPILNFEVHDLTIDDRGVVWLATTDGLLQYDGEKITLIQNDILGQEEMRGVTHYANNSIWIATATKGLVFHQDNTSTILGEIEGLPAVISAYRCITTDASGHLWAGTAEGLVYSRSAAASLPYSKTPRLRAVLVGGRETATASVTNAEVEVRQNEELYLEFTNLSFPAKNVQYQYRVVPKEDKALLLEEQLWQSIPTGNTLALNGIELGNHQLELRARQTGGYRWSAPLQLDVRVFLPWYAQSWLRYTLFAALLLIIGYFFRFYIKRRFSRLQSVLNYSNEKLAKKEEQLHQKVREFEEQQTELDNANLNIRTLELFIKEIPKKASWNDVITAMGKAVNESSEIHAFEIAFKEKNEIVHRGYSSMERSGYTFRSKPFNAKSSLTCWAMANDKEVLINDFRKEHTQYIDEKEAYHFDSLIFIPFALENAQPVVLCAYSTEKDQFDHNDIVMFRILSQFIHFSIHQKISKKI